MFLALWAYSHGGVILVTYIALAITLNYKIIASRIPYLTRNSPTVPIGIVRSVKCESREKSIPIHSFKAMYWFVVSLMVVPYEDIVIFIDEKFHKKNEECNYVLTPQEKVHSNVHCGYNRKTIEVICEQNRNMLPVICASKALFKYVTLVIQNVMPGVMSGMVAMHENKFYYDHNVDGFFKTFDGAEDRTPILDKVFLWHMYEELEHHLEALELYRREFGPVGGILRCLAITPAYYVLFYTVNAIAFLSTLLEFNVDFFPKNVFDMIVELIKTDVTTVWSLILVGFGLSSKDEKIQSDLQDYRDRYLDRYGIDLTEESLVL